MQPRVMYFEDFKVGQVFETPARTVTEADIVNFAGVSGDFYNLHTDEEYAKKTIYGGRIAHGLLVLSMVSGLWFRIGVFDGSLIAFYGIDRLRFTAPVRPGDTIRARLTVTGKEEKRYGGVVTFKNEVFNQRDELVLVFDSKIVIAYRGSRGAQA